jgi:hypothetical protein
MRFLALLLLSASCFGQARPDPAKTPGAIRTSDATELCAKSFRTKKWRIATEETKKKVCAAYGVKDCPKKNAMELDDLVALEIGGENVEGNLWVQMAPEYHFKDKLENKLKKLVCAQPTDELKDALLIEAQQEIRTDWVAAYRKYVGKLPQQKESE